MFCTKCGANLPDGTMFCTNCGSALEASAPVEPVAPVYAPEIETPVSQESSKIDINAVKNQLSDTLKPVTKGVKSIFSKKGVRFGVIAGIVLLLVVGILGAIFFSGNGFVSVKQEVLLQAEDGTLNIIVNGKVLKDTIDLPVKKDFEGNPVKDGNGDKTYYSYESYSSMDGKVTAILVYGTTYKIDLETGRTDSNLDSELYVLKGKKLQHVAEDVADFRVSVTGKGITFVTENERKEDDKFSTYTLSLYNVGNKKTTTVSDEALGLGELSPDGKSVAYFVGEYNEKEYKIERTLMLHSGKKSTEITDKDVSLIGLSNKGKYIYAVERETKNDKTELTMYCFNNKGKSTKLGECDDDIGYMNKDHTQVMFYEDGNTYIANKTKAEKVSKKELNSMMTPDSAGYVRYTYPVANLYGQVYSVDADTGYDLYMIKKGGKENKLVDGGYDFTMDESGDYIYYTTKKDDLKCVKISMNKNAKSKAKDIAEDVMSYEVTSNRKHVYFINDDEELMCVNGKKGGKVKEICTDEVSTIALSKKDVLFYLVKEDDDKEGEVFATKNGSKGKLVQDDIARLGASNFVVFATTENGEDIYISTGSKKMKLLELN